MGVVANIDIDHYPRQTNFTGTRVLVCFKYDKDHTVPAVIIRDDDEDPNRTILRLDDGRIVLGTECQWRSLMPHENGRYPEPEHVPVFTGRTPCPAEGAL